MFYKFIYLLGRNFRNPSIKKQLAFLKESESWSLEKLENYQFKKLQELLNFAFTYSNYYKQKMLELEIEPSDIRNLGDIKKLPILTKKDILEHNSIIHTNFKFKKKFKAITSGTTGQSLEFYRDEFADSFNRASIIKGYELFEVKPWDRNGYFWGFSFSLIKKIKTIILDRFQNRFRVFSYDEKAFNKFVNKLQKAKYIHGYSSMLYQAAKTINEKKLLKPEKILMVKGTSEKIFEKYQDEVKKAFGLKMISEYGATESGIIAFECPSGNMHINMEGVIVEEIENEILVTHLQMKSFPIIRYRLGDYIKLAPKEKKCNCGKEHLILEDITGRVGSNIYGVKQIYPSFTFYYIFKNLSNNDNIILNYQVIQKEKGLLVFKIEQFLNEEESTKLKNEIYKYFKDDMRIEIEQNSNLNTFKGKLKSFISKVNE
ncbi:Phenylacetate-coenzyme A ligase [Polaribacter huanghezhanensis]|uniref:phenylacetate--CoA ligase family protein n=1 Tax=Polaribacter huanghezhanensis TaxID=1354726 RepID=UPI00264886C0|nr:phenylacetate--CoA ligase family protein [Polaribacter huanghezhanensis]WKD86515.1 Phenylacetate-coenzyme A ligase [Polaribacter huanghezhanensis]